jgi:hypothetical protein
MVLSRIFKARNIGKKYEKDLENGLDVKKISFFKARLSSSLLLRLKNLLPCRLGFLDNSPDRTRSPNRNRACSI